MRNLVIAAAIAACLCTSAYADVSAFYGNTLSVTSEGKTSKVFVNQDGTYEQDLPGGMVLKGTYVDKDGSACYTQLSPPATNATPVCVQDGDHKIGDSWQGTANGKPAVMTLTSGR